MKFIPEQLDPITRRFVETHPGGSAIEVTSRGQQLRYLLTALLLLLLDRCHSLLLLLCCSVRCSVCRGRA